MFIIIRFNSLYMSVCNTTYQIGWTENVEEAFPFPYNEEQLARDVIRVLICDQPKKKLEPEQFDLMYVDEHPLADY